MKSLIVAVLFGTFLVGSASAGSFRQERWDNDRYNDGYNYRSNDRYGWNGSYDRGRLTPAEAARIQRQRQNLYRQYSRDRWDGGGLSYRERQNLERKRYQLNRRTHRDRYDRDRRW